MYDWIKEFWVGLEASVNPYSEQQIFLFFVWLVVFTAASVTVIMAERRMFRLIAWLVGTVFSFGLLQAGWITVTIAASYWPAAIAATAGTAASSIWIGRRRRPRY